MTTSLDVRTGLLRTLRRDLIGPGPEDDDLHRERLPGTDKPSSWYMAGFIVPVEDESAAVAQGESDLGQDDEDRLANDVGEDQADAEIGPGAAADNEEPEAPPPARRFFPVSLGLTVLLDPGVTALQVVVNWGDYVTEPPLPPEVLAADASGHAPRVDWVRIPRESRATITIGDGRGGPLLLPDSAARR